eukprot:jgi/Mesen1/8200/ME000442S07482
MFLLRQDDGSALKQAPGTGVSHSHQAQAPGTGTSAKLRGADRSAQMDEGSYWARVRRVAAMMDMRTALVTDAQLADALHVLAAHEDRARGGRAREPGGGLLGEKRLPEAGRREGEARGLAEVSSMQGELEEQQHRLLLQRQQLRGGGGDEEQRVEEEEGEDEEVAAARKIKDAVLHPGGCSMAASGSSSYSSLERTYNSLHYYANRNASNEESPRRVLEAYLGATASSVGAAVGLNAWIDRAPPGAKWAAPLLENVVVPGEDERRRGRESLEQTQTFVKKPWLKTPALMGMIGISIQVCVPLFFGIFRQQASVEVHKLEAHLHDAKDKFGRPIDRVTYNKGI